MAVFGDTLRQARAHKGVTLKEAEQATRISRHHLLALEEEQFDELPALIYQRGIVRNYATYLNLDPNRLLSMFQQARGGSPDDAPLVVPTQNLEVPGHFTPNFAIIAFLVVMSAVVFAWGYSVYFSADDNTTTQEEQIPTVTPVKGDTIFTPPTATERPAPSPTPLPQVTVDATEPLAESVVTEEATVEVVEDATEAPIVEVDATQSADSSEEIVDPAVTEEATQESVSTEPVSFSFYTSVDCTIQVVGDGVLLWDGFLGAGTSTGYLTAKSFSVFVDDPDAIEIIREDGTSYRMNADSIELP